MRLKSALWVAAYVRQCDVACVPAIVVRRGAESAGAIYIKINCLNGTARLLTPAPQSLLEAETTNRRWIAINGGEPVEEAEIDRKLSRESSFDPDIWIVEVEDRQGRDFLGDNLVSDPGNGLS